MNKKLMITGLVILGVLLVVYLNYSNKIQTAKETITENNVLIDELDLKEQVAGEELASANTIATMEPMVIDSEAFLDYMAKATQSGTDVAVLQTKYQTLSGATTPEELKENANQLDAYFDETSKSGRTPWYGSEEIESTWTFEKVYMIADNNIRGIWLCKNNDNSEVLAYAQGDYNIETGLFSNIVRKMTNVGQSYIPPEGEEVPVIDPERVQGLINSINEVELEPSREPTPEEMDELTENRERAREEAMGGN